MIEKKVLFVKNGGQSSSRKIWFNKRALKLTESKYKYQVNKINKIYGLCFPTFLRFL